MNLVGNKLFAAVLMLLVLFGQTSALANDPCQIMTENHATMQSIEKVQAMDCEENSPSKINDCCDYNCSCPLGDHTSAIIHLTPSTNDELNSLIRENKSPFLILLSIPQSPFRPPIIT